MSVLVALAEVHWDGSRHVRAHERLLPGIILASIIAGWVVFMIGIATFISLFTLYPRPQLPRGSRGSSGLPSSCTRDLHHRGHGMRCVCSPPHTGCRAVN